MSIASFLPGLSRPDIAQMSIFLTIFTCSVFGLAGNWPGVSYLLNNGTLLFICIFTIGLPNAKSYYLFSYALMLSPVIDAFSIGLNWHLYNGVIVDFIFYWSLAFALLLIVFKLAFSLHQLEIAKNLNNELSPVSDVYKIHAIQQIVNAKPNLAKTSKVAEPTKIANDIEAVPMKSMQTAAQATAAVPVQTQIQQETEKQPEQAVKVVEQTAIVTTPVTETTTTSEAVPQPVESQN